MNQISKKALVCSICFFMIFLCNTQASAIGYRWTGHPKAGLYSQFTVQRIEFPTTIDSFYNDSTRATNRVVLTVAPGKFVKAASAFSLETGETVKVNLSYSPQYASMEAGLVGPSGNFRYVRGANGTIQKPILISETGKYYLAFRNNSNVSVQITGFIYY